MSALFVLQSIFELFLVSFVFWGIFNEGKLVAFEKRIACNIRRRKLKIAKTNSFVLTTKQ